MANDLGKSYKNFHKPNQKETSRTFQGYYIVVNKQKYIGDPNLIIYRSAWEYSFLRWCDHSPSIIKFSSEPISVSYLDKISKLEECKKYGLNPNDPRYFVKRNYHVDFWIVIDKGNGITEKMFVEIKPKSQYIKPIPPPPNAPQKLQKQFVLNAKQYLINEAKWQAMSEYAKKVGSSFYVFNEDTLQKIIGNFFLEKPPTK